MGFHRVLRTAFLAILGVGLLSGHSFAGDGTFYQRFKPALLHGLGDGQTPPGDGGGQHETATLSFIASGRISLTQGDPFTIGIASSVADSGVTFQAAATATMPGLEVDPATGAVSGTPNGAADSTYSIAVSALRGGSVIGTSPTLSVTLHAPLQVALVPGDMALPYGGPFPEEGIMATAIGGDRDTIAWALENAPDWLAIENVSPGVAVLRHVAGKTIGDTEARIVRLVATDADEREDRTATFTVSAEGIPPCDQLVGSVCPDGSVYVGLSRPAGGSWKMFMAQSDIVNVQWSVSATLAPGLADETANLFDGLGNVTRSLTLVDVDQLPAIKACKQLGPDWYIPARVELQQIPSLSAQLGPYALGSGNYLTSSTNATGSQVYYQNAGGVHVATSPSAVLTVRCFKRTPA